MKEVSHYLGLDLGQTTDFTALAVLERRVVRTVSDLDPVYAVRHLERFPLGTPYPDIVRQIIRMMKLPALTGATLVVDQTGVGLAVVDLFRETMRGPVACTFAPVTISSGHKAHLVNGAAIVPKKELVSTLQVLLQTRRLHIASVLPHAEVLVREMENFKVKITEAANETFSSWREGIHDDLVLAVALAGWAAEQVVGGRRTKLRAEAAEKRRRARV